MSETTENEIVPDETHTETTDDEKSPKWYRDQIESEKRKRLEAERKLLDQAFSLAGIDTSKGVGKTMREMYQGGADRDEILSFAAEKFEFAPAPSGPDPERSAVNEAIADASSATDRIIGNTRTATPTPNIDDEIDRAQSEGRWQDYIALQNRRAMQRQS